MSEEIVSERVRDVLYESHGLVARITTPAGQGSPLGLHTHDFDQVFYVLEGTMFIEVEGVQSTLEAGSSVVFPAGVPHRNWNEEQTTHLALQFNL